jgi:hypothetical protein
MKKQSGKSGDIPMLFIEFHNWRRAQPAYKRFGLRSLPTHRQIEWPLLAREAILLPNSFPRTQD